MDFIDEAWLAALIGLLTGAVFGVAAQRSSFCPRAATIEFACGTLGPSVSVSVWLLAFSTAVIWVQGAQLSGLIFAVVAQMSLHGRLAPVRSWFAALWVTPGGQSVNLVEAFGLKDVAGLGVGLAIAAVAMVLFGQNGIGFWQMVYASGVGFAEALG